MDEFLQKMQEDQRRMRRFLRARGPRFKQMGEALAATRHLGSRVFVVCEPPLDALAVVLAEDYLTHLPALPVDLTRPAPGSVDPDQSGEVVTGRAAAARQVGRHLHAGDIVLAFLADGADRETRMVLESARAKRITTLVISGMRLDAMVKRLATVRVSLPSEGVKTLCEASFVCARILGRISRATWREAGDVEEEHLVQVTCDTCTERVFFEEKQRGRQASCPLCQNRTRVPKDAGRRATIHIAPPQVEGGGRRRKSRRLKPSVLEVPVLPAGDGDDEVADSPRPPSASERDDDPDAAGSAGPSGSRDKTRSRGQRGSSRDRVRPTSRAEEPRRAPSATPPPQLEAPVGLVSHDAPAGGPQPELGSDFLVGSDVGAAPLAAGPRGRAGAAAGTTTASADPYALEDAFLADLEMPGGGAGASSASSVEGESRRLVSARFTAAECRVRWGRGGWPDESSPPHELIGLTSARLEFFLDPDDEAGSTLQKGDELWLRIEIPAFVEPVLVRGQLMTISGTSGGGRRGARAELEFQDPDPSVRRKLTRASESMGAPA